MRIKWVTLISIWVMMTGGFLMTVFIHHMWGSPGLSDFVFRYGLATVIGNFVWIVAINMANNLTGKTLGSGFYWPYALFSQLFTVVGALLAVAFTWLVQKREIGLVYDSNGAYFLGTYGVLFSIWVFAAFSYSIYLRYERYLDDITPS